MNMAIALCLLTNRVISIVCRASMEGLFRVNSINSIMSSCCYLFVFSYHLPFCTPRMIPHEARFWIAIAP